jgi:putative endonuclease
MTETTSNDNNWFVYIVEATNGKLYTGITTDVERRFREHAEGKKGARFFRTTTPVRIVWQEAYPDRSSATKREMVIKKMSRQKKLALIANRSQS